VPRYSDDSLLRRALVCALLDRESLLDAYSGEGPTADDIRVQIANMQALRGKKLANMTPEEDETARLAFVYGEQWEAGLADVRPGPETEKAARKNIELFREVRVRRWGKTVHEAAMENSVSVPITEFLKRK
jgi:hypothetical protein